MATFRERFESRMNQWLNNEKSDTESSGNWRSRDIVDRPNGRVFKLQLWGGEVFFLHHKLY